MADFLHDYWTDDLIGPATADQVLLSDASIRMGGDGKILVDRAGHICAFASHVEPGPDIRAVFTQPDATSRAAEPTGPLTLPPWWPASTHGRTARPETLPRLKRSHLAVGDRAGPTPGR